MKIENNIQLIGTIATDIKLIDSPRGQYTFTKLTIKNEYKDKITNQIKEFYQFIPISFYGEEKIKKTKELRKGIKILVCGSIIYSSYFDQNKNQKTYFSVICEKFEILSQIKELKEKEKEIGFDENKQSIDVKENNQNNELKRIEDVFSFEDMEEMFK